MGTNFGLLMIVGLGDCEWLGSSSMGAGVGRGLRLLDNRGIATFPVGWVVWATKLHTAAEGVPSLSIMAELPFFLASSPRCFLLLRVQPFLLDALGSTSSGSGVVCDVWGNGDGVEFETLVFLLCRF